MALYIWHSPRTVPVFTGSLASCQNLHRQELDPAPDRLNKGITDNNNNDQSPPGGADIPGLAFEVAKAPTTTSAQNVQFVDADSPWAYSINSELDETYQLAGYQDAQLGDFFSRPIKIATYSWTPEAQLFETFNPWRAYLTDDAVIEKLNYYKNFRASLCLKVMLNGNSFYYGRALLSYNPYLINDDVTRNRAFFVQDLIGASQRPHVLLDPCSSQGAHMCLPFIWPENWLNMAHSEWEDSLGECIIHDFNVLKHANGGSDPITVSIFAWCEDVQICVPTSTSVNFNAPLPMPPQGGEDSDVKLDEFGYPIPYQAQAGGPKKTKAKSKGGNTTKQSDEFTRDGLISKPASAIAVAGDALSMIPLIAPYAKAVSMVASKVGQVARLFGYSRPQILSDTQAYVPRFMGNITNTDSPENLQKLSVDSKNELTIDSRVTGMDGSDEMTISSIVQRESYLTQFQWSEAATPDTMIFSIAVDPMQFDVISVSPVKELHPTALTFACVPFSYWQGSIKFRFQIICSEYHRGRLRFVYDPENYLSPADGGYNKSYSTVIDISQDRDFEYECKWTETASWQRCDDLLHAGNTQKWGTVTPYNGGSNIANGTLTVFVLNELATPSITPADVTVLVWMSGGDDFSLAVPRSFDSLNQSAYFEQQATWRYIAPRCKDCGLDYRKCNCPEGEVYQAQAEEMVSTQDTSNIPIGPASIPSYGDKLIPQNNEYLVYQGERIFSFRELLRRYHYHSSYFVENGAANSYGIRQYIIQNFPRYRGWDPNGAEAGVNHTNVLPSSYNYCAQTLMNYLTPAFVCRRGSIRYKYCFDGKLASNTVSMRVSRWDVPSVNSTNFQDFKTAVGANFGGQKKQLLGAKLSGSGSIVTPIVNNPVMELELPFYTKGQRFVAARDLQYNVSREHEAHSLSIIANQGGIDAYTHIDAYVAAGEDFSLSMFIGAPIMYAYYDPVASI